MEFNGIPDSVLDIVIGEYWDGEYTLRTSLKSAKDIIVAHEYALNKDGTLSAFIAWTPRHVLALLEGPLGDKDICAFPRNPDGSATSDSEKTASEPE